MEKLTLTILFVLFLNSHCQEQSTQNTLRIIGEHSQQFKPKLIKFIAQFQQTGENAEEVQKSIEDRVQNLTQVLQNDLNITQDQIKSLPLMINPIYKVKYIAAQKMFENELQGFEGSQKIQLLTDKQEFIDKLSLLNKYLDENNGKQVGKTKFVINDEQEDQIREILSAKSVENALKLVKQQAKLLGIKVVGISNVLQNQFSLDQEFLEESINFLSNVMLDFTTEPLQDEQEELPLQDEQEEFVRGKLILAKNGVQAAKNGLDTDQNSLNTTAQNQQN